MFLPFSGGPRGKVFGMGAGVKVHRPARVYELLRLGPLQAKEKAVRDAIWQS